MHKSITHSQKLASRVSIAFSPGRGYSHLRRLELPTPIRHLTMSTSPASSVPMYQKNSCLYEMSTSIRKCCPVHDLSPEDKVLFKNSEERDHVIATHDTIFHPQGGGQPSDIGQIVSENAELSFNVKLVRKAAHEILHLGSFNGPSKMEEDNAVTQKLDAATRNLHSRYHTAGHIIGLAVKSLRERIGQVSELKANHAPGMAFVEFRGLIAGEHKDAIQEKSTEIANAGLAVKVEWWTEDVATERQALPEGFVVPSDGNIRMVEIEGLGAYPCGGTHLPSTSDVGKIVVRKISRQKGVTKISYEVEH